nr:hypothetical protein [Candidatus Sigynarchaeota archaeon]
MRFFKILDSRTKKYYENGITIGKTSIAIVYLFTAMLLTYTFIFSWMTEYWVSFWEVSPTLWMAILLALSACLVMKFPSNPIVQLYVIFINIEYLQGSLVGFDYLRAFMEYEGAYFPQVWLIFSNYPATAIVGVVFGVLFWLGTALILVGFAYNILRSIYVFVHTKQRDSEALEYQKGSDHHVITVRSFKRIVSKQTVALLLIPLAIAGSLYIVNRLAPLDPVIVNPGDNTVRLSVWGAPTELNIVSMNKSWVENTTEGQAFTAQLMRHNATLYIGIRHTDIDTDAECNAWADYIDYLHDLGIFISMDAAGDDFPCYTHFDEWFRSFQAVVEFRTNVTYMPRLQGLVGVSGDFEAPQDRRGINRTLLAEVIDRMEAGIAWMRQKLLAVGLSSADFKFGSVSGVPLDGLDGDYDQTAISEFWPDFPYDFNLPMLYDDGVIPQNVYRGCRDQYYWIKDYAPGCEMRTLLGITGGGRFQNSSTIDACVRNIQIARAWNVTEVCFFSITEEKSIFHCFEGQAGVINGSAVTISKYNVFDAIMNEVYKNASFTMYVVAVPEQLPDDQLGGSGAFRDYWNTYFLNLIEPYRIQFYTDLCMNLDHGDLIIWTILVLSVIVPIVLPVAMSRFIVARRDVK